MVCVGGFVCCSSFRTKNSGPYIGRSRSHPPMLPDARHGIVVLTSCQRKPRDHTRLGVWDAWEGWFAVLRSGRKIPVPYVGRSHSHPAMAPELPPLAHRATVWRRCRRPGARGHLTRRLFGAMARRIAALICDWVERGPRAAKFQQKKKGQRGGVNGTRYRGETCRSWTFGSCGQVFRIV